MTVTIEKHPGKILFVDADGDQPDNEMDASAVPESIAYADTPDGRRAVVKVVKSTTGEQRHIRQYGTDGALLRTTVQTHQPPPKNQRRPFTTK